WWPVGTTDQVLVFVALVLGYVNRTHVGTETNGSNSHRLFRPQVDDGGQTVTTGGVDVTTGSGHAGNVYRVTTFQNFPDLVGITIDQGQLARVTQGYCE